jgi:long-subunit fatty acid transport protein
MQRNALAILLAACVLLSLPRAVHAGGVEFPAGGTRSLGRGAAGMARADDPSVMVRNPALLADLWDDQAMLAGHMVLTSGCFQATGGYGWNTSGAPDQSDFGQGPILLNSPSGATDLNGKPLSNYAAEPFPNVCLHGHVQILPSLALAMKLTPDLGVGLGFFPPDQDNMTQWGNSDGTVDTANGKRPNPMRFGPIGSMQAVSYFSLLGAVGYRVANWLRIGGGLQWTAVAFNGRGWTELNASQVDPHTNTATDSFGRDLFIPGVVASVDIKPIDNLDIALGFRWSDRVKSKAKLDINAGYWGTGQLYPFLDGSGNVQNIGTSIPHTENNVIASVSAPPIYVPQISFALRYADRLQPEPKDRAKAHAAAGRTVEDHMQTERWDIEGDAIYYLNKANDQTTATINGGTLTIPQLNADGTVMQSKPFEIGHCTVPLVDKSCPNSSRLVVLPHNGKNQMSVRVGGDYNVLPGLFALRAGVSYETNGQQIQFIEFTNYMLQRVGLHVGFTLRVAKKTDISFAFAHFIQEHVKLQVNDTQAAYPSRYKDPKYHFEPGAGVADANGQNANANNGFDGVAQQPLPNGTMRTVTEVGPDFVNAGTYNVNLDVASMTLTQHF